MIARALYWLVTHLVAPFVAALDAWRALGDPAQRGRVRERLGWTQARVAPGAIWVHAVSVGEVQAAAVLVHELEALDRLGPSPVHRQSYAPVQLRRPR